VTKENLSFIRSTAKDLAKLGLKRFAATPASPNVEHCGQQNELLNKEQIVKLLEALKWCSEKLDLKVDVVEPLPKCFLPKWCWEKDYSFTQRSCQAGRNSVSISNTGDVRLCSHNPTIYGNLFLESLESIWKRINDSKDSYVPTECHQCPSLSFCHGACRIDSLITTGLLNKPNPLMTGHISPPKENEAIIKDEAIISFEGKLKWRKETNYYYSVCSKNHPLNLTTVNDEFFNFLVWLEKCPPLTIKDLFKRCATNSDRVTFDKIIKILLRKKFVKILDL
jgi:radical SAM protein with 4Fe4S-binding SPASM domain